MSFVKSKTYPGWIYDSEHRDFISPSGRTAERPGAPFTGTLTKKDFQLVKELVSEVVIEKSPQKETPMAKETTYEIVKTYRLGDVTVNIIKAY